MLRQLREGYGAEELPEAAKGYGVTDWRYWITWEGTVTANDEDSARDQAFDRISRWFDGGAYLTSAPEVELEEIEPVEGSE